jgi:hypothetical protein
MNFLLPRFDSVYVVPHRKFITHLGQIRSITPKDRDPNLFIDSRFIENGFIPSRVLVATFKGTALQLVKLFEDSLSSSSKSALSYCLEDLYIEAQRDQLTLENETVSDSDMTLGFLEYEPDAASDDIKRLKILLSKRLKHVGKALHAPLHSFATQSLMFYLLIQIYGKVAIPTRALQSSFLPMAKQEGPNESSNQQPFLHSRL